LLFGVSAAFMAAGKQRSAPADLRDAVAEGPMYIPKHKSVDLGYLFPAAMGGDKGLRQHVDMNGLFADGDRDQAQLGSCHIFSAIAVLEAAYARQYGRTIRLSEADLFLRRMILGSQSVASLADGVPLFAQGGSAATDLNFALKTGVASGPDYYEFQKKFQAMSEFVSEKLPRDWLMLNSRDKDKVSADLEKKLEDWFGLNTEENSGARARTKKAFEGFSVDSESFPGQVIGGWLSPSPAGEDCRKSSVGVTSRIAGALDAGRPVSVALYWEQSRSAHVVTFIGYDTDNYGRFRFSVRNSWGGYGDAPIDENSLCHVMEISSVLLPSEKK